MKKLLFLLVLCFVFMTTRVMAQETKYILHTIAKGETLSVLAKKYHISVGDIMRLNGMNSKSHLTIGEKIKIPSASAKTQSSAGTETSSASYGDSMTTTHYVL